MPKTPLQRLLAVLADFQEHAAAQEKAAAVPHLKRLYRKLEIESLSLLESRLKLTTAEGAKDRETLQDLADFSPFEEVKTWATEVLNPKPRTPGYPRISLL